VKLSPVEISTRSYSSGNLKNNETLIAAKDGTSSMAGSAGRSARVSI